MSPLVPRSRRRRLALGGSLLVLLLGLAVAAGMLTQEPGDVSNPDVAFTSEPPPTVTPTPPPETRRGRRRAARDTFVWGTYGYSKDRRRQLPADPSLRPPFHRVWKLPGRVLLEFPPALAGPRMFLLKNNGSLYTLSKRTGRVLWRRSLGVLAASAPAYGDGRVFVTLLSRARGQRRGRVVALHPRTGRVLWGQPLRSRSESSPLVHDGRIFFGAEDGTVYAMRASDGRVMWRYRANGAVKGGLALAGGKLYFGDYGGRVHAISVANGNKIWVARTSGRRFGGSGNFYSTPAVAYGRVYIGSTDGRIYSFSSDNGKLAWAKKTSGYVYASPAVAGLSGVPPLVYAGSYNGTFYALDARSGKVRWSFKSGGKISGSATVVGDIVYFSDLGKKSTYGLGARTGKKVFEFSRGAFNPVVSDGRMLFVTGYAQLFAFRPKA